MVRVFIALWVLLGFSHLAQAEVIYNWQEIAPSIGDYSYDAQIIFTDEAYLSGRTYVEYNYGSTQNYFCNFAPTDACQTTADVGILGFSWQINHPSDPIFYFDKLMHVHIDGRYPSVDFRGFFTFGPFLTAYFSTGEIGFGDTFQQIRFELLAEDIWFVSWWGSDEHNANCDEILSMPEVCGATGRWVLDQSTVPRVSEPPILFLALFGLAGLIRVRHRRIAQTI